MKEVSTMNSETVSIIVPIYNTETYLRKCIDSLLNQTYKYIEIILVNDGSTDSSFSICQEYANKYANVMVINQRNRGVSAARNVGISESSGKYLTFVDSDDVLSTDAVEIMHNLILEKKVDVVSASMAAEKNMIDSRAENTYNIFSGEEAVLWSIKSISLSVCAKLFKKQSIQGLCFDETRKINEDGYFVFQCCTRNLKILECSNTLYWYSERPNSSSRADFSEKFLDMLYFVEKKKDYVLQNYPQYKSEIIQLEVSTNLNLLQLLCATNDRKYNNLKQQCCSIVRKHPFLYTGSFLKYQKVLFCAINFRMFWLYQLLTRKLLKK